MLQDAQQRGWDVFGAAANEEAINLADVKVTKPTVLVMGNEGFGLRTNVKRACNTLVCIEDGMPSGSKRLDSLNVSVATGILLHHLLISSRS